MRQVVGHNIVQQHDVVRAQVRRGRLRQEVLAADGAGTDVRDHRQHVLPDPRRIRHDRHSPRRARKSNHVDAIVCRQRLSVGEDHGDLLDVGGNAERRFGVAGGSHLNRRPIHRQTVGDNRHRRAKRISPEVDHSCKASEVIAALDRPPQAHIAHGQALTRATDELERHLYRLSRQVQVDRAIGDGDHLAIVARLRRRQTGRDADRAREIASVTLRLDCVERVEHIGWRSVLDHDLGHGASGDERDTRAWRGTIDDVGNLLPRGGEACRWNVARGHARRRIQHYHQPPIATAQRARTRKGQARQNRHQKLERQQNVPSRSPPRRFGFQVARHALPQQQARHHLWSVSRLNQVQDEDDRQRQEEPEA